MLRLLVGDECTQIGVQVTIGHPETSKCHSEPFGKTCRRGVRLRLTRSPQVVSLRTGSTKRGTVILSPAWAGLRMTYKCQTSEWILANKAIQFWSMYALSGLCPLLSYMLEKLRPLVGEIHSAKALEGWTISFQKYPSPESQSMRSELLGRFQTFGKKKFCIFSPRFLEAVGTLCYIWHSMVTITPP